MDLELENKVAIVTGASRGLGRAIALALSSEGMVVVLAARGEEALSGLVDEIKKRGGRALAVAADLTRPEETDRLIRQTLDHFSRIDVLVNNLGGPLHFKPFLALTDADWQATFDLDLMVTTRLCRGAIPSMQRQKEGRIINIASTSGMEMDEKFPDYRVAKTALIALGKYLSLAFASDHILVNTLCPGAIWTSSWDREAEGMAARQSLSLTEAVQALRQATSDQIPLGRMGTPEDVARFVAFLASPRLTFLTGATLRIDGGASRFIV